MLVSLDVSLRDLPYINELSSGSFEEDMASRRLKCVAVYQHCFGFSRDFKHDNCLLRSHFAAKVERTSGAVVLRLSLFTAKTTT